MVNVGKRAIVAIGLMLFSVGSARAVEPADQLQFADGLFARGLYDLAVQEYRALADSTDAAQADLATYRIGEALREQGRDAAARAAYEETVRRFPDTPAAIRARFRLAEAAANSGQFEEAQQAFRALADRSDLPGDLTAPAAYYLGYTAHRLQRDQDAEAAYARLLKVAPNSAYAYLGAVDLAVLRIAARAKTADIESLLKIASAQTNVPRAAIEALTLLGDYAYRQKNYVQSADAYGKLFERFPKDPAVSIARLSAAWAYLKAGRVEEALRQVPHAQAGSEAAWLYLEANAKRLSGKASDAQATYEALLKSYAAAPEAGPAAYELTLLLFQQRDYSNAYIRAQQASLTDETRGDLLWLRAETARETGRTEEAIEGYDQIVGAASGVDAERVIAARFQAARLKQNADAWADASARYRVLVEHAPQSPLAADALFASAFCQTQLKDHKQALADWAKLIREYPDYSARDQALFGKAQSELALEQTAAAETSLNALLKDFPSSATAPEAHLLYGNLLEQKENYQAAEFHYAQALRKQQSPELARRIQFRQLAVLQRQGRSDEAAATLNALLSAGAAGDVPVQLLDWAARWNLSHSNFPAAVTAAQMLASQRVSPAWMQIGHYLAGRAFLEQSLADQAGAAFKSAAGAGVTTEEGLESAWRWGEWAVSKGKWADAETAFQLAAEKASAPEAAEIRAKSYYGLGRVAEGQGRWADAARQYLAVAVLYENPVLTPDALDAASRMFEKAGDAKSAAQTRRELAERFPDDAREKR